MFACGYSTVTQLYQSLLSFCHCTKSLTPFFICTVYLQSFKINFKGPVTPPPTRPVYIPPPTTPIDDPEEDLSN